MQENSLIPQRVLSTQNTRVRVSQVHSLLIRPFRSVPSGISSWFNVPQNKMEHTLLFEWHYLSRIAVTSTKKYISLRNASTTCNFNGSDCSIKKSFSSFFCFNRSLHPYVYSSVREYHPFWRHVPSSKLRLNIFTKSPLYFWISREEGSTGFFFSSFNFYDHCSHLIQPVDTCSRRILWAIFPRETVANLTKLGRGCLNSRIVCSEIFVCPVMEVLKSSWES